MTEEIDMNSSGFKGLDNQRKTTWDDLKQEFDSIKRDAAIINNMEVSEEAKAPILAELKKQINEVKEKMHDYIDSL
jgi:hypothetical protein